MCKLRLGSTGLSPDGLSSVDDDLMSVLTVVTLDVVRVFDRIRDFDRLAHLMYACPMWCIRGKTLSVSDGRRTKTDERYRSRGGRRKTFNTLRPRLRPRRCCGYGRR